MDVINEIKGDIYKKLIDYVFENCNQFSLFFRYSHAYGALDKEVGKIFSKYDKITDELFPDILEEINSSDFMKKYLDSHSDVALRAKNYHETLNLLKKYEINREYSRFDNYLELEGNYIYGVTHFFRLDSELKQFLLKKNSINDWVAWNISMENLCFYIDDFCFSTSVAHENMLGINCRNKEEYEYLKSIGIEFYEKEFIKTNDVFIS